MGTHAETIEWVVENIVGNDSTKLYLMDYNLPEVHFENNNLGVFYLGQRSSCAVIIYEFFSSFNFRQYNYIKNKFGSTLDLIFSANYDLSVSNSINSMYRF